MDLVLNHLYYEDDNEGDDDSDGDDGHCGDGDNLAVARPITLQSAEPPLLLNAACQFQKHQVKRIAKLCCSAVTCCAL